jgi:hypothetical protein
VISQNRYEYPFTALLKKNFEGALPRFVGFILFGTPVIFINDFQLLDDLYLKKNPYYSKHEIERQSGKPLLGEDNIVTM